MNKLEIIESDGCVKLLKIKNSIKCMIDGTLVKV